MSVAERTLDSSTPVRLGARTSPLARVQAAHVAGLLAEQGVASVFVGVTTTGDVDPRALTEIGGTGVFAGAVRDAVRAGEVDVAVHSLKDLPTAPEPDLEVAAVPAREDTRDVLVGLTVADLHDRARGPLRIGTGAPRRALQLADLATRTGAEIEVVPVRGNVDTRLRLVREGQVDAVVLAAAGLIRLGHLRLDDSDDAASSPPVRVADLPAQVLGLDVMLPAPGQGALALEISGSLSFALATRIRSLDDHRARAESLTERGFLAALEAGCTAPVGARARLTGVSGGHLDLTLDAVIGRTLLSNLSEPTKAGSPLRRTLSGRVTDPREFGVSAGVQVLGEMRHN
jgi:hydroxymethylbilane synthase